MELNYLKDYRFYVKISYLTVLAGLTTLMITQIIKWILKKKKIIDEETEASKKDEMLSRIGRIVGLIAYTGFYIWNEMILKHNIVFDEALITGILTGGALTLTVAKGIYTTLHQWSQKKNVYERLEYAEKVNRELSETLEKLSESETGKQTKWILTKKK